MRSKVVFPALSGIMGWRNVGVDIDTICSRLLAAVVELCRISPVKTTEVMAGTGI